MPSYHSLFNSKSYNLACGIPLIDFKTNKIPDLDSSKLKNINMNDLTIDIIDESLMYFRANILFKNFPILGDADKVIVYLSVFIAKCLEVIYPYTNDVDKMKQIVKNLVDEAEYTPTLKTHFLNTLTNVKNNSEISQLQQYLKTLRKETVNRLMYILFDSDAKTLDLKYWAMFGKRKFLGYDMPLIKK